MTASLIWDGVVVERPDFRRDYGEPWVPAYGKVNGRLLVVVFTVRQPNRRIISARKANRREQRYYEAELGNRKQDGLGRFDAITDEEIAESIRNDPDVAPEANEEWFRGATLVMPQTKQQISIRLDRDVLEHFRRYPRYQTRINAILRATMERDKEAG